MSASSTEPAPERAPGPRTGRWAAVLAASAAWAGAVPYVADVLGARLDVAASVEVVDHVVPAVAVLAAAVVLVAAGPGELRWSIAAGATFLAGFWIIATHVPLVLEALDGVTPWDAALLHSSAGLPVLAAGGWMLLAPLAGGSDE